MCEAVLSKLQEKAGILAQNSYTSVALIGRIIFLTCEKTPFAILIGRINFSRVKTIVHSSDWLELMWVPKFTTQLFGEYFSVRI